MFSVVSSSKAPVLTPRESRKRKKGGGVGDGVEDFESGETKYEYT